jgi:DNA-binding transcriptional regulator YiaG
MTNIATALKAEVQRIARKEIRSQTAQFRKASSQYRRDIAALKRQLATLERALRGSRKRAAESSDTAASEAVGAKRFSAKGLRSHRVRLGLSAREAGRLLGVSAQSVNNWENQKAVPRPSQVAAIAALRSMGKRAAQEKLAAH